MIQSEETKRKKSESVKGEKNPFFGRHHSEEAKIKISEFAKGRHFTEEHKRKLSEVQKGRKGLNLGIPRSEETKRRISKGLKGSKNPHWKGGISPIVELIRGSSKSKQWRTDCLIRDKFTCRKCGYKGENLEVHHRKSFYKFLVEIKNYLPLFDLYEGAMLYIPLWDISNGITLCKKCHKNKRFPKPNGRKARIPSDLERDDRKGINAELASK
jgi:5-methylcytosine-specific restriction endonuclease McrA